MKRIIISAVLLSACGAFAQESGGIKPCIASYCVGPRVGLEMNEGIPVESAEILNICIPCIMPAKAFEKNGLEGCIWSCCAGPRVGMQLDVRKPRGKEKFIAFYGVLSSVVSGFVPQATITLYEYEYETANGYGYVNYGINLLSLPTTIVRVMIAMEAFNGKTMTEIEAAEGLAK